VTVFFVRWAQIDLLTYLLINVRGNGLVEDVPIRNVRCCRISQYASVGRPRDAVWWRDCALVRRDAVTRATCEERRALSIDFLRACFIEPTDASSPNIKRKESTYVRDATATKK